MTNAATQAARQTVLALINGANPADVVGDPAVYGEWWALITNLTSAHTAGGHDATKRGFDAIARANKDVAALVADAAPSAVNHTDLGNARRLVRQHGENIRYVPAWGQWLVWNGTRWVKDETGEIDRLARRTVATLYTEAATLPEDARKELAKWAIKSESRGHLEAMVALAQAEPGVPIRHLDLDAHPYLINCTNGTINLRSGELQPHQRSDLLTKQIAVAYDPHASCPTWLAFLHRIMDGDTELVTFLQRAIGYTLTGDTSEQCLFFLYGTGKNGKSTFSETLMALLGDYQQKAPTEMLMAKQQSSSVPNDVARLVGARFVVASEVEEGRRLAEALIKDLTGGDTVVARFLRQEFFEFRPTHKLWIYGNHKPIIRGTDEGIWRRIRLVPFTVWIPPEERDGNLQEKLIKHELPGILTWAVHGCLDWQRDGLGEPEAVQHATATYRSEMDVIGAFLSECCTVNPKAFGWANALYSAYTDWCDDNGETAVNQRRFGMQLTERGFDRQRSTGGRHKWQGVGLAASDPSSDVSDPSE